MKYVKPRSLTWCASATPLLMGVFLAMEPVHGITVAVTVINSMTNGVGPYVLINAGLVGIGIRGAL